MPVGSARYPGVEDDARRGDGLRGQRSGRIKHANIGISLPGTGEVPVAPVYVDGKKTVTLKGERIAEEFQAIVEEYVERQIRQEAHPDQGCLTCKK